MATRQTSNTPSLENETGAATNVSPTMTPEGPIFRDDFNSQLNAAWTWENEDASRYRMNENGWLEITGGDESIMTNGQQTNLLWITLPEDDFEIFIHLKSQPQSDFQRAGLLLYKDSEHYISLSRGYCMQCVLGGNGIFLEYNLNGSQGRYTTATNAVDLYLMLISRQGVVGAFYAVEWHHWQYLASLGSNVDFERVSLSVTNDSTWDDGYDVVGRFDYFEIRRHMPFVPTPTPILLRQG
ncbi:MAG: hypothetical protein HYZ22_14320 [Chloroflexi bacterium]|nr:hypothetical protein [Chloroflexota bacterium]